MARHQALSYADVQRQPKQRPQRDVILLLDGVSDQQNLAAVVRLSDALGIHTIYSSQVIDQDRKFQRIARMTGANLKIEYADISKVINQLNASTTCLALELTSQSLPLSQWMTKNNTKSIALVAGNEQQGVSQSVLNQCQAVHLPTQGQNSSMNVAQALGMAAYALMYHSA